MFVENFIEKQQLQRLIYFWICFRNSFSSFADAFCKFFLFALLDSFSWPNHKFPDTCRPSLVASLPFSPAFEWPIKEVEWAGKTKMQIKNTTFFNIHNKMCKRTHAHTHPQDDASV